MSKASDSFVREHIEVLMPHSWHHVLETVRVPYGLIELSSGVKHTIPLKSFMLMGSGHTFPLQTLLFYSLAKAVVELSGSSSKVDVYGDDIILPSRYAIRFAAVMEELGFTINSEKSFWTGFFRESCGADYTMGVDVRPFTLEHVCGNYTQKDCTALLYKMYNGLLERWDPCEIPRTLDAILVHILLVKGRLNVVPNNEPPDSGLFLVPDSWRPLAQFPRWIDGTLSYYKLQRRPRRRKPKGERIYYWYSLCPKGAPDPYGDDDGHPVLDRWGKETVKGSAPYSWVQAN
jgi:hypothetical protein